MKETEFKIETIIESHTDLLRLDLAGLYQYRDLIWLLIRREFVSKYKQTVLGPGWFIFQSIVMPVVFTIIFSRVAQLSTDSLPPILFYMSAMLGWNYFSQTFGTIGTTFTSNMGIFSKVYFPRLVAPIASMVSNVFIFLIQLFTFLAFFTYYKYFTEIGAHLHFSIYLLLIPFLLLHVMVLGMGVGLLITALTAKYRDFIQVMGLLTQLWFYATPIILPYSEVKGIYRSLMIYNPMTSVVESFRFILLGKSSIEPRMILISVGTTIVILMLGLVAFHRVERTVVDIL